MAPMTVRTVVEGGGTIAALDKIRRVLKLSWNWSSAQTPAGIGRDLGRRRKGIRGKPHRTTIPDNKAPCPLDKVNS